jgi:hypothetical protein
MSTSHEVESPTVGLFLLNERLLNFFMYKKIAYFTFLLIMLKVIVPKLSKRKKHWQRHSPN